MIQNDLSLITASGGADKLYVDDVFSTWLYTGNGSTQTITNGIDLAGKGGLVWVKSRTDTEWNYLEDTTGHGRQLSTNYTDSFGSDSITNNSNGFSLTSYVGVNGTGRNYVSWTFRKAAKFFDCGTYTGDGAGSKLISHSLGVAPGLVICKPITSSAFYNGNWRVWHRGTGANCVGGLELNTTASALQTSIANSSSFTASTFDAAQVYDTGANTANYNGASYVWYAFAHDTSAEGIIQCGSFTTDGSGNATVTLGWEPQFLIQKLSSGSDGWKMFDSMRGFYAAGGPSNARLYADLSNAESSDVNPKLTATGFTLSGLSASQAYIYLAIRRPNKPPTTGTQVYGAEVYSGTSAARSSNIGFSPDLIHSYMRDGTISYSNAFIDRLRGPKAYLTSATSGAELVSSFPSTDVVSFNMNGHTEGNAQYIDLNISGRTFVNHFFKRAPGVFDVVAYTGTGSARTVNHSLGAVPELMIVKAMNAAGAWSVYSASIGSTKRLVLNTTAAEEVISGIWNNTNPTASLFTAGPNIAGNGTTYIAYLFASSPGISKVGSYTGNGSSLNLDMGFSAGARFFMCKRTDSTGDWYVWDSVRGIIAGNDPHLSLNTTAAEVTSNDSIDPIAQGLTVNQVAATNINVNAATYIYLAFA